MIKLLTKLRNKVINFVNSSKEGVVISAIAAGLYPFLFYYNSNFNQVNSWSQFLFFIVVFVLLPIFVFLVVYKGLKYFFKENKNLKFVLPLLNFCCFGILMLVSTYGLRSRKLIAFVLFLSLVLTFLVVKHFKKIVILQLLMSFLALSILVTTLYKFIFYSDEWLQQPDNIEQVVFKEKPNIYMIQVDGYANFSELNLPPYNFDNSHFEAYLKEKEFKLYSGYRSNYFSTLSSNASLFTMSHHYYSNPNIAFGELFKAREIIVGNNPVLSILNKNNYKTHLILERPYFLVNRPKMAYDISNVVSSELPYLDRGFKTKRDVKSALFSMISKSKDSANFYFVQKLSPSHVTNSSSNSVDKDNQRVLYLDRLKETNIWLKEVIEKIEYKDKNALIVISADHGGFVGFQTTLHSTIKQTDDALIRSIFTSTLAIKWVNNAPDFDSKFKSPVNFFRILFSHLSNDHKYLDNLKADKSFIKIDQGAPFGVYEYINEKGEVVFEKNK